MAAAGVLEVNESNFESEVLQSPTPVLVDFWAPWCGPCKMLSPAIDQLAQEVGGKYRIAKVNTDDAPTVAAQYRIQSIPTLLIFKGGKEVNRISGVVPMSQLRKSLDAANESA